MARLGDYSAISVDFLPDESATVDAVRDAESRAIVILRSNLAKLDGSTLPKQSWRSFTPSRKHWRSWTCAIRLSVLDLASGRVAPVLFFNGIRPPIDAAYVFGPDYPRDWLTMAPNALEDLLQQRHREIIQRCDQEIESQPQNQVDSLKKASRAQIEFFMNKAREAFATTRAQIGSRTGAIGRFVSRMMFDPSGDRLFVATWTGVRAYLWRDIVKASGEMPPPQIGVDLEPGPAPEVHIRGSKNTVGVLAHDPDRDWLLFAGEEGPCAISTSPAGGRASF